MYCPSCGSFISGMQGGDPQTGLLRCVGGCAKVFKFEQVLPVTLKELLENVSHTDYNHIQQIRRIREDTGLALKQAKDLADIILAVVR